MSVWLRDVGSNDDPCWVVCAKGDPGAVEFEPKRGHDLLVRLAEHCGTFTNNEISAMCRAEIAKIKGENSLSAAEGQK